MFANKLSVARTSECPRSSVLLLVPADIIEDRGILRFIYVYSHLKLHA